MKIISIGTDRKIFEENSAVKKRQIEYGKYFDELYIIVFSLKNQNLKSYKLSNNVWAYPTNSKNKLLYIWDAFKISKNLISIFSKKNKNFKNNIIISTQDPFETGLVGTFVKLFFDLPLYTQVHTDFRHKYFVESSVLNKIRFMMAEFVLKYSNRVRVVSERIKNGIESFSKNIDVLPIRAEVSQREPFKNFPKGSTWEVEKPFSFTLIMVCRLEKEKNIETVLKAIKKLDNKNLGLCIVGDGGERKNLENMVQNMGILDKVIFVGWQDDLVPYYKMADAFISSSLYEGYGVSTMEAASFEKPLILSDTGIAGEIFKENASVDGNNYGSAFICDAKDINCFTQNILKISEDEALRQRMGQSAKIVADNYLNLQNNYFEKYANSIKNTATNFKKRNFILRIIKFKKILWNSIILLRYFICGLTAATFNIGLLYVFTDIVGIWYLYSSILAFLAALIVSFILQKFVVFKDLKTDGIHKQFSKFSIVAVLGVITNTVIIFICVDVFGIWYIFSQIIAGFFVMIQNFILYKFFIFNRK